MRTIDLTEQEGPLFDLLAHGLDWRLRRIEHLELGAATRLRLTTRHHCELPPDLVPEDEDADADDDGEPRQLRLRLPLGTRRKTPLLNFSAAGPGGTPAHLIPRADSALLQSRYLSRLRDATSLGGAAAALGENLLLAICVHAPIAWDAFLGEYRTPDAPHHSRVEAMQAYLEATAGVEAELSDVYRWLARTDRAGRRLAKALGEPPDLERSSSECVLLALHHLDPAPETPEDVDAIVVGYGDAIKLLDEQADAGDEAAADFLSVLADYGRRWELMLDVELEDGRPATVTTAEDRLFELAGSTVDHRIAFGEAVSVHVEAQVTDPAVEIARIAVRDVETGRRVAVGPVPGEPVRIGPLELAQHLGDTVSIYSSADEAPYYGDLYIELKPIADVRWPPIAACALIVLAVAAALLAGDGDDGNGLADNLALIVVPSTFAAAFAVVRERSTLAMHLQRPVNIALGAGVMALWGVAALRVLLEG